MRACSPALSLNTASGVYGIEVEGPIAARTDVKTPEEYFLLYLLPRISLLCALTSLKCSGVLVVAIEVDYCL